MAKKKKQNRGIINFVRTLETDSELKLSEVLLPFCYKGIKIKKKCFKFDTLHYATVLYILAQCIKKHGFVNVIGQF